MSAGGSTTAPEVRAGPARLLQRIAKEALWAPLAVVVFQAVAMRFHLRTFDELPHVLGGLAIAYFSYRCLVILAPYIGELTRLARYLFAFALGCTMALFWEIAEFCADTFLGTHIQTSLRETMLDLVFGVMGMIACLLTIFLGGRAASTK